MKVNSIVLLSHQDGLSLPLSLYTTRKIVAGLKNFGYQEK